MNELERIEKIEQIPEERRYSRQAVFDKECDFIKQYISAIVESNTSVNGDVERAMSNKNVVILSIKRKFETADDVEVWKEEEIRKFDEDVKNTPRKKELIAYKWLRNIAVLLEIAVFFGIMITEDLTLFIMIPAVILAFGAYIFGSGSSILIGSYYNYLEQSKIKGYIMAIVGIILIIAMTALRTFMSDSVSYIVAIMTAVIALFIAVFEFMYEFDKTKRKYYLNRIFKTQRVYAVREQNKLIRAGHWETIYDGVCMQKSKFITDRNYNPQNPN